MKNRFHSILVFALLSITAAMPAGAIEPGDAAPPFTVYAGKKDTLHSSELSGKVIVMTYESRDTVDINKPFKDQVLKAFPRHADMQSPVAILAVVSCFEFIWPMDRYCISEVQKNARQLRMRLYDDRTGDMLKDFGLKKDASNVLIIDSQGIVRYAHAGKLLDSVVSRVISLMNSLSPSKQDSPPRQ